MARQFIYHMQSLSKVYPGNRKVLPRLASRATRLLSMSAVGTTTV